MAGHPDPFATSQWSKLSYVLKGIKRDQAKESRSCIRLPIPPAILRKIQAAWPEQGPASYDRVMLWEAFMLGFFGFLHAEEFTVPSDTAFDPQKHLALADIAVDSHHNPSLLRVHIKRSKTDPFRQGVHIYLGKTDNQLCPVTAMIDYLAIRGEDPGPLLRFQDGRPLTRSQLVTQVCMALLQANIPVDESKFSGHSLRIGAATAATERGMEDSLIKMLGRWESGAYHWYIRMPREQLAMVSRSFRSQQQPASHSNQGPTSCHLRGVRSRITEVTIHPSIEPILLCPLMRYLFLWSHCSCPIISNFARVTQFDQD